jgi:hypothetical protein
MSKKLLFIYFLLASTAASAQGLLPDVPDIPQFPTSSPRIPHVPPGLPPLPSQLPPHREPIPPPNQPYDDRTIVLKVWQLQALLAQASAEATLTCGRAEDAMTDVKKQITADDHCSGHWWCRVLDQIRGR